MKKTYKNLKNVEVTRVAILTDGLPPAHQPHKDASEGQKQYLGAFGIFSKSKNPNEEYKDLLNKHFKLDNIEVSVEETRLNEKETILKGWQETDKLIKYRRPIVMWKDDKGKFLRIALTETSHLQEPPAVHVTAAGDKLVEVAFDKSKYSQPQAKEWLKDHLLSTEKGELDTLNEQQIQELVQKTVDSAITKLVDEIAVIKASEDDEDEDTDTSTEEEGKGKKNKAKETDEADIAKTVSEAVIKAVAPLQAEIAELKKQRMKKSSQLTPTSPEEIRKAFEEKGQVDLGDGRVLVKDNMWSNIPALAPFDCRIEKAAGGQQPVTNEQIASALGRLLSKEVNADANR
jgi:hypothetical protein